MTEHAEHARRAVVTGGAGFLGYHLARRLVDDGRAVTLVDNLERGRLDDDLASLCARPSVRLACLDLTTATAADLAWEVDAGDAPVDVYHLAAVNGTTHFYERPAHVLRTNALSLIHVVDWACSRAAHAPTRLLFTSSNEAYAGALAAFDLPLPTPEDVPLVVADPYNPRWSYAGSKIFGELYAIHAAPHAELPVVICRPHNVYGPRAGDDHVVPGLIRRILGRMDPFPLPGSDETRSPCYVDDCAHALVLAMEEASVGAPTLHVGSTEEVSVLHLAERLFAIAGWAPSRVEHRPSPPGSVRRRLPDVRRIAELTGWSAATPLDDGLRATLAWYERQGNQQEGRA